MKKALSIMMMAMLIMAMTISSAFAAESQVDWSSNVITAVGNGIAPQNAINAAQARFMARRAAVVEAYRNLAEMVKGVNITGESTVANGLLMNDNASSKVSAFIQGARIVSERMTPDGGYEVTMQAPLFGISNSLAQAVMPKPAVKESFPTPSVQVNVNVGGTQTIGTPSVTMPSTTESNNGGSSAANPSGIAQMTVQQEGIYTGLIVDCRGLGLKPVMSPVIKNENLESIYGYKNLDYDKVVSQGMAGYATSMDNATRAGSRPLVVKAIKLIGNGANPVLSMYDANKVLVENQATHFLDNTNVVFLR